MYNVVVFTEVILLIWHVYNVSRATTDTPLPTPSHRFNAWADDRKSLGITPAGEGSGADGEVRFKNDKEREEWEDEQKVRVRASSSVCE